MIRVARIAPTASYEPEVHLPGEAFLALNPCPTRAEFNRHDYWSAIHSEMYDAYAGICMYCASWTPRTPSGASLLQTSIDHFFPKGKFPLLAYRWDNFRLSRHDLNTAKGQDYHITDPFGIRDGWYMIDFGTWRIEPSDFAPIYAVQRIRTSCVRLGLNSDAYVEERQGAAAVYVHRPADRDDLQPLYPFLVGELQRQAAGTALLHELAEILPAPG